MDLPAFGFRERGLVGAERSGRVTARVGGASLRDQSFEGFAQAFDQSNWFICA